MCDGARETTPSAGCLARLEAATDGLQLLPGQDRTPDELRDQMLRLRRVIGVLELEFASTMAAFATCDELEWEGHTSPIQWVRRECHTSAWAAATALQVGEQSARLPESTRALRAGEIGYAHLGMLAQTAEAVAGLERVGGFDETALLRKARKHSVGQFFRDCAHARHAADPRRFLEDEIDKVEARSLAFTILRNGCLGLRGFLDPERGATLRTALETLAKPIGRDDDRDRDRRSPTPWWSSPATPSTPVLCLSMPDSGPTCR